jgi:hypothetical protein
MHLIVCFYCAQVCIQKQFIQLLTWHFFTHVAWVPKQKFKVLIHVGEKVTPIDIKIGMTQYGYIMVWPWVSNIDVNEETLVVNNDHVVHQMDFFLPLNHGLVRHIVSKLASMNLMQHGEISNPTCKGNPLLDNQPLDLICNSLINAWQNEYHIIANKSLGPIPHECVMHGHIVMLEV